MENQNLNSILPEDFISLSLRNNEWKEKISGLISFLYKTDDSEWCTDVVRTLDNKNCLFGHVVNYFNQGSDEDKTDFAWSWFEDNVSTTYIVYKINDGKNPNYNQKTAKARCISYLENILSGKELTTHEGMDYEFAKYRLR